MHENGILTSSNRSLRRRNYLQAAGAAAVGAATLSGNAAGSSRYDRVVDVVEAGADNTGNEPIDAVVEEYMTDGTLFEFPDGTYLVDQLNFYKNSRTGMVATGDATLVPASQKDYWIAGWNIRDFRFEGFTLDTSADGIHPNLAFGAHDDLVVKDITRVGLHDGTNQAFGFAILDEDGSGLVENVEATDGSIRFHLEGPYNGGATGMYVETTGTLTFRDCHLEKWGDNGIYASWSTGPVQVEGGTFKNCDVAQVRLGSDGSYVDGATIVVDDPREHDLDLRGVRICDGPDSGKVEVRNCDIAIEKGPSPGGVVGAYNGGSFDVYDTNIHVGEEAYPPGSGGDRGARGIYVAEPVDVPAGRRRFENVSVTGTGDATHAVYLRRDNNVLSNVCVHQSGQTRGGIRFNESANNAVENANINVNAQAITTESGSSVDVTGLTYGDTCPYPGFMSTTQSVPSYDSYADAPFPYNANRLPFPKLGPTADKPTVRFYGNFADERTHDMVRNWILPLANEYVAPGRAVFEFHSLPYDPAGGDDAGWEYMAKLGLSVWDIDYDDFWKVAEHTAKYPPYTAELTWEEAWRYLDSAGVDHPKWVAARVYDHYDETLQRSVQYAKDAGVPALGYLSYEGEVHSATTDWAYDFLDQRL